MSQYYVPGPTRISVGQHGGSTLSFLGWAVDGVTITIQPRHDELFSDLSGPAVPEDVQFLGEDAMIRFTLSRYNDSVLAGVRSFRYGGTEGAWESCALGSLMKHEGFGFRLFLRSPCQSKSGQTGQRGVWNFPLCYPLEYESNLSLKATKPRVTFRALADIESADGSAILYNSTSTGEPANYTLSL